MISSKLPQMLFLRDYRGFSGGHLKYIQYIKHVVSHGRFRPVLHVTKESKQDELALLLPEAVDRVDLPHTCNAIFVAGQDWAVLDAKGQQTATIPVINLIQGVRHADPALPLYGYLSRPATRICVSAQVAEAILATGQVNGPVHVIENGVDLPELDALRQEKRNGKVLIAGLKDRPLAVATSGTLSALRIPHEVLTTHMPRPDFLAHLANFDHAILLPRPKEGFFLPALEAMALGVSVVMPDCVGARAFAVNGESCIIADRDPHALARAAASLVGDRKQTDTLRSGGRDIACRSSLERERRQLFDILDALQGDGSPAAYWQPETWSTAYANDQRTRQSSIGLTR